MNDTVLQALQNKQHDFTLQRGSVMGGHLIFMGDITRLTLFNNPALSELVSGRFSHHLPSIQVQEGKITIQYHNSCFINQSISPHVSQGKIRLNPMIPWEIEVHGNLSNLDADLRELELRSLDFLGSVNGIRLLLSKPRHTSFIYMAGGIHSGRIHVPPSIGIRVRMNKSIAKLELGNQQSNETSGATNLENSDFKRATSRYDIYLAGEASNITIEQ